LTINSNTNNNNKIIIIIVAAATTATTAETTEALTRPQQHFIKTRLHFNKRVVFYPHRVEKLPNATLIRPLMHNGNYVKTPVPNANENPIDPPPPENQRNRLICKLFLLWENRLPNVVAQCGARRSP